MSEICLVRQPNFGTSGALVGYDIRYRDTDSGRQALMDTVLSGTYDLVRGGLPAFIACDRAMLLENARHMFDPAANILLLPRDLEVDADVIAAVATYRDEGGHIALDELDESEAPSEQLLPFASWVRVDMRSDDADVIGRVCTRVLQRNADARVMALHVGDEAQYEMALQLGAEAFQGTFFSSTEPVPATVLAASSVAASRKSTSGVDQELVRRAVERGRLLEQCSGGGRDAGTLFLVGMFSLLDAVFRMSLHEILERVTLSDDANAALLDRTGPYADALSFAESYELGMFEHAAQLARDMGVDPSRMNVMYTNALSWTNEALGTMVEGQPSGR